MLTVVIRSVANPDLYIPLQPGVLIEAKRLLFIRSNVCNLQECADYHHTSFECVETYSTKRVSVVTMKSYDTYPLHGRTQSSHHYRRNWR
jgi:hypothetical protein